MRSVKEITTAGRKERNVIRDDTLATKSQSVSHHNWIRILAATMRLFCCFRVLMSIIRKWFNVHYFITWTTSASVRVMMIGVAIEMKYCAAALVKSLTMRCGWLSTRIYRARRVTERARVRFSPRHLDHCVIHVSRKFIHECFQFHLSERQEMTFPSNR